MHLDDAVRDRQAESRAHAHLLGGEERVEDLRQVLLGDAHPGIDHLDGDGVGVVAEVDGELAPLGHGVLGVGIEVGEHLHHLVGVDVGDGVGQAVVHLHLHVLGHRGGADGLLHQLGHVGGLAEHPVLAGKVEQAGDDALAAVGLVDDGLDIFSRLRVLVALLEHEVGMEEERAQRVVHLVRDAGGELAHAGELARPLEGLLGLFEGAVRDLQFLERASQLLDGVRQTHLRAGQSRVESTGVLQAGVVAAGTAVELVLGLELAHAMEDLLQFFRRGGVAQRLLLVDIIVAREIDVGVALLRFLDGAQLLVCEVGDAVAGVVADAGASLEHGAVAGHARTGVAALAGKHVQQARVGVGDVELADGVDEFVSPVGHDDLTAQQVLLHLGCLQQSSGDGKDHPDPAVWGIEQTLILERFGFDATLLEHVPQLGERQHRLDLLVGEVDGGPLLGHARSDEDHSEVLPQLVAEHPGHGDHGGDQWSEIGHELGMVLAHERDHRRTRGGDVALVGVPFEQAAISLRHQVGSERDLMDRLEAQRPDHGYQRSGRHVGELRREARRHHRRHRRHPVR